MIERSAIVRILLGVSCAFPLIFASTASGDTDVNPDNPSKSILTLGQKDMNLRSMSILDPDRFTMKQQYYMGFSSTNGNGGVMGMYINNMEYRFNAPLIMRLKVAYQSQTGKLFGNQSYSGLPNSQQGRMFVPAFDMVYKPWKNTTFVFSYRDFTGMSPYSSYNGYSPYNRYNRYNPYNNSMFDSGWGYGYDMSMYRMLYEWDALDRRSAGR